MRPELSKVPKAFHNYVNQVQENEVLTAFSNQGKTIFQLLESIPAEKHDYRYDTGKWTIREVLQHIIDAERVFAYRALAFARKDKTSLPPFDENDYALNSMASGRNWSDMVEEFRHLRKANEIMFQSFSDEQLDTYGTSNNNSISVRALGFVMVGHATHHARIVKERYIDSVTA